MSEDPITNPNEDLDDEQESSWEGGADLSSLLKPDWVAQLGSGDSVSAWQDYKVDEKPDRFGKGQGQRRDRRDDRSAGPRRAPAPGADRRDSRGAPSQARPGGRPGAGNSRGPGGGPGAPREQGRGRGPDREDRRGAPPQPYPLPEGITAEVRPDAQAVEAMSAHIKTTKRAYSLFDAAKLILGDAGRFRIKYVAAAGKALHIVRPDNAVFLQTSEAMERFLHSGEAQKFYEEQTVDVEAPKGNFTSIAVCGISGHVFGPPNHHSYLPAVVRHHQQHFARMPLEDYKRKIKIISDPAAVEEWKEKQSKAKRWIWKPGAAPVLDSSEAPAAEAAREAEIEQELVPNSPAEFQVDSVGEEVAPSGAVDASPDSEAEEISEPEVSETVAETAEEAENETVESTESPVAEEETGDAPIGESEPTQAEVVLRDAREWEEHVREHYGRHAVKVRRDATVAGNVPKKDLSPELYSLLRNSVDIVRKRPDIMVQKLCRAFENRGFKLFKRRGGKLYVSAVKPAALDSNIALSERVGKVVSILRAKPELKLGELLENLHAAEDGGNITWLEDIHWLADQGYVIIFSDDLVTLGVRLEKAKTTGGESAKDKETPPAPVTAPASGPVAFDPESPSPSGSADSNAEAVAPEIHPSEAAEVALQFEPVEEITSPETADSAPVEAAEGTEESSSEI